MLACSALVALLAPGVAGSPAASLLPDAAASGSSCAACDDETWTRSLAHPAKGGVGSIGTVDVVVSYCNHDLAWLDAYVEGLQKLGAPVRNVTIYSKCQQPAPEAKSGVKWSQTVVELPNVGRCDHTYAYHMSEAYADLADATVYIKDSYDPNAPQSDRVKDGLDQVRDVKETWERTKSDGVSCLYDSGASHGASVWHAAQAVGAFKLAGYSEELSKLKVLGRMDVKIDEKMSRGQHDAIQSMTVAKEQQANFMSPVRPLAAWLKQTTGIALDERKLWPVCYGGNFAATRRPLPRAPRVHVHVMSMLQAREPDPHAHPARPAQRKGRSCRR